MGAAYPDHGFRGGRAKFVIFAQSSRPSHPGEAPLPDPALGQNLLTLVGLGRRIIANAPSEQNLVFWMLREFAAQMEIDSYRDATPMLE